MTRIDVAVSGAGTGAAIWNFFASGHLNTLLAAIIGILTILVLLQRYRINRRELRNKGTSTGAE
ncbi:MAG: hypothetical protein HOK21_20450 [Rhodospirillaceae bacterium]|jgi:hypothetical protein|nr:hypothetical protein [Rhodospirillaceae bacterium]MBT4045462.1 hypothetical protein [Rhodospirillaceae bacterium]MBT4690443.1 hypothetical protein [Rhodospirillaceae bacterium]MBT5083161.1 hypothetical protein [Rhodospirillaceae bacterium]MBT5526464.1 hypothetical protein [Rhodospirillaceae bacterium]